VNASGPMRVKSVRMTDTQISWVDEHGQQAVRDLIEKAMKRRAK